MTTIHSAVAKASLRLASRDDGTLAIDLPEGAATYDRAEFLAAVATELDCTIIPRTDLPEVTEADGCYRVGSQAFPASVIHQKAHRIRAAALESLALAEHLDAHPPLDEAQVNAVRGLLAEHGQVAADLSKGWTELARRLVQAGVTIKEN